MCFKAGHSIFEEYTPQTFYGVYYFPVYAFFLYLENLPHFYSVGPMLKYVQYGVHVGYKALPCRSTIAF